MISADTRGRFPAGHVCGLLLAAVMVVLTGCIQIEETIEVKENGSGKLTEVIRFDDRLIQTTKRVSQVEGLAELLGEVRLKERMALYGDVTLASHEVHDLDGKGQESVSVFEFSDIRKLTLPGLPNRSRNWPKQMISFKLGEPEIFWSWTDNAYYLFQPLGVVLNPKFQDTQPATNSLTPLERERYVSVLPSMRVLLNDFRFSVILKAWGPVDGKSSHTVVDVRAENFENDDLLMNVLLWNRFPDQYLAPLGHYAPHASTGLGGGQVMNADYEVRIALNRRPTEEQIKAYWDKRK